MKCVKGYEIQVLHSGTGYYIGTFCNDGPNCRISNYYKTKDKAQKALDDIAFGRYASEIDFCNNGLSCIQSQSPYIVSYQYPDYDYECEIEFDNLSDALARAQQVEMDGVWANIIDSNGIQIY